MEPGINDLIKKEEELGTKKLEIKLKM